MTTKLQLKLQDNALRNNQLLNLIQRIAFSFKSFDNWIVKLLEKHVLPSGNAFPSVGGRWLPLKTGCISVRHFLGYNLIFYFGFGATPKQEIYIGFGGGGQLISLIYKLPQATDVQLRYDLGSTHIIG